MASKTKYPLTSGGRSASVKRSKKAKYFNNGGGQTMPKTWYTSMCSCASAGCGVVGCVGRKW